MPNSTGQPSLATFLSCNRRRALYSTPGATERAVSGQGRSAETAPSIALPCSSSKESFLSGSSPLSRRSSDFESPRFRVFNTDGEVLFCNSKHRNALVSLCKNRHADIAKAANGSLERWKPLLAGLARANDLATRAWTFRDPVRSSWPWISADKFGHAGKQTTQMLLRFLLSLHPRACFATVATIHSFPL